MDLSIHEKCGWLFLNNEDPYEIIDILVKWCEWGALQQTTKILRSRGKIVTEGWVGARRLFRLISLAATKTMARCWKLTRYLFPEQHHTRSPDRRNVSRVFTYIKVGEDAWSILHVVQGENVSIGIGIATWPFTFDSFCLVYVHSIPNHAFSAKNALDSCGCFQGGMRSDVGVLLTWAWFWLD